MFTATVSLRDHRNLEPAGLEVLAERPTVRMPDKRSLAELRFRVPVEAQSLTIRNFDAANGEVTFVSAFRTQALIIGPLVGQVQAELGYELANRPDWVGIIYPGPTPFAKNRTAPAIPRSTGGSRGSRASPPRSSTRTSCRRTCRRRSPTTTCSSRRAWA